MSEYLPTITNPAAASPQPEHVRNFVGLITFWRTLSVVLVQIGLWALAYLLPIWVVPHLPQLLLTGWRLPLTVFSSGVIRWFALLMVLQYTWTIVRATGATAVTAVMAEFGSESAKRSLDDAPGQLIEKAEETRKSPAQTGRTGNSA